MAILKFYYLQFLRCGQQSEFILLFAARLLLAPVMAVAGYSKLGWNNSELDGVARALPVGRKGDEAGFDQDLQMLGDGRLGEWQLVDEVAGDACIPGDEETQDVHPDRMAQCLGE